MCAGISRRPDIAYEYTNGDVEYDEIEDPLPFDINAPVVKIEDGDYALWYRDLSEDPKKYDGKVVEYKGLAAVNPRMKPGMFFFGRQLMTCCVEDIQFAGLLTLCDADKMPENGKWYTMRLSVAYKWHKLYGRKGPVLTLQNIEPAEGAAQPRCDVLLSLNSLPVGFSKVGGVIFFIYFSVYGVESARFMVY